jgi:hypothetical protein
LQTVRTRNADDFESNPQKLAINLQWQRYLLLLPQKSLSPNWRDVGTDDGLADRHQRIHRGQGSTWIWHGLARLNRPSPRHNR